METKSGLTKHASSEIEYSPREPYKPPNIARETGAAEVYKSNIIMNKSAGAYDSLPPNLTDSDSESDSESEPETDQEHVVKEISIKYQLDLSPDITDNASAGEIGSEKIDPEDDADLIIMAWNKDKNAENSDPVSSKDTKRMSNDSTRLQLGINQPLGMALSENRFKKGIETVTKSGVANMSFQK